MSLGGSFLPFKPPRLFTCLKTESMLTLYEQMMKEVRKHMRTASYLVSTGLKTLGASFVGLVLLLMTFASSLVFVSFNAAPVYLTLGIVTGAAVVLGMIALFASQIIMRVAMRGLQSSVDPAMAYRMKVNSYR